MKNKKVSLWKTIPLALLMTLGMGKTKVQEIPQNSLNNSDSTKVECVSEDRSSKQESDYNYIYSKDPNFAVSGEGVFAKRYINEMELNPNSRVDLGNLLYAKKGDLKFEVMSSEKGLENAVLYLNSSRNEGDKEFFEKYEKELKDYIKSNPSDSISLSLLNKAVADGIIDVKKDSLYSNGRWNIKDGENAIILAKSSEIDSLKSQSVPVLYQINTSELERIADSTKNDSIKQYLAEISKLEGFLDNVGNMNGKKSEVKKSDKHNLYIIGGLNGNLKSVGGKLGLQYGKFALLANYGMRADERVEETTTSPSPLTGRYGHGTIDNENIRNLGLALEYSPFSKGIFSTLIGVGANLFNYTEKTTEEIRSLKGGTLAREVNSYSKSEPSWKAYGGAQFKLNKKGKNNLRLSAGYDSKNKFFGGIGYSRKLP